MTHNYIIVSELSPEAIKQSREILYGAETDKPSFQKALGLFAVEDFSGLPEPGSQEANQFIDDVKPQRFAALAKAIDTLLETSLQKRDERDYLGLLPSTSVRESPWSHLESQFLNTFATDIESLKNEKSHVYAEQFCGLIKKLDPGRRICLEGQLFSGANTATDTNLGLLRIMPGLIASFSPNTRRSQYASIAKGSTGLNFILSRRSIESMMAARSVLIGEFSDSGTIASKFLPVYKNNGLVAVKYNRLEDQIIPEGYRSIRQSVPLESDQPLRNIRSASGTIIGCPITLLSNRSNELWHWMVDAVDKSGVWEKTS